MKTLFYISAVFVCLHCVVGCKYDSQNNKNISHENLKHGVLGVDGETSRDIILYYSNGMKKSTYCRKNGLPVGLVKDFNIDGSIAKEVKYSNKSILQYAIFYEKNLPTEKQIYNSVGKIIRVIGYNSSGKKISDIIMPLFYGNDTVLINNEYATRVRFGYPVKGEIRMIVGKIDKYGEVVDTERIIYPTKNMDFIYYVLPKNIGENKISYKFTQRNGGENVVNDLTGIHRYYVKE